MSKLDKEQIIEAFTQAYTAANGKAPKIEAKGGWYSVDGGKNMRLADLNAMIDDLGKSAPAAKKAPAEKPKKAAAKKAPAKKKAKKSDFSVKAFWADQILTQNTGSKLPR
ncbi:hypothetical protein [Paraglaciecola aestuariivivens]